MEISMDIKQRYMRSILGQRPFTYTFNILDNREVAFTTLTVDSANTLRKLEQGIADNDDKLCTLRALWHIDGIVGWETLETIVKDIHTDPSTYDMVYPTLSEEMTTLLWNLYKEFVQILEALREEVSNKDFWTGAG